MAKQKISGPTDKTTDQTTDQEEQASVKYVSKFRICNPYQNVCVDNTPVEIIVDSFWQSQIDAGIMTKC